MKSMLKQKKGSIEAVFFFIFFILIAGFLGYMILDYFVAEVIPVSDDVMDDINQSWTNAGKNATEIAEFEDKWIDVLDDIAQVKRWFFFGFLIIGLAAAISIAYFYRVSQIRN